MDQLDHLENLEHVEVTCHNFFLDFLH
jgi:hypothetical protein